MARLLNLVMTMTIVLTQMATPTIPSPDSRFMIQLSDADVDRTQRADVWELDLWDADPADVAWMRTNNTLPVCYFSVGTWEDWRPDADEFAPELIGNDWQEWPGERYVDIRQVEQLAPVLEARLDLCQAKGFLAVDPDNIDSWGADTGFSLTEDDAMAFAQWLVKAAHKRNLLIAQKNAPELTSRLVGSFDFAVTEDCASDDWCQDMQPYVDHGKPVFAIEYTDRTNAPAFALVCQDSGRAGISPLLTDRDLTGAVRWCD